MALLICIYVVALKPQTQTLRVIGKQITYDKACDCWPLGFKGVRNVAVYVNGLRYAQSKDYTIVDGNLKKIGTNINSSAFVLVDFETGS